MPTIGETSRPGFVYDSATDTWIPVGIGPHAHTPAAIGAISSSVVTTKGDLIVATGSGTVVRQGVGADGSVLMADSAQADGVSYAGTMQFAGKNKMINGDFGVWQRGTSVSVTAGSNIFTADRYQAYVNGGTATATQQTFTPGAAPVAGYEGTYFHRLTNAAGGTYWELQQKIEDVRTYAGQAVTFSFWAKASSAHLARTYINQYFGVSGSANNGSGSADVALTTSWQRYTLTVTLGSMAGKTIGAGSYINIFLFHVSGAIGSVSIDTWGWQLEPGSVATPFQTATGNPQAELAACQRYYVRMGGSTPYERFGFGSAPTTSRVDMQVTLPVPMRTQPSSVEYGSLLLDPGGAGIAITTLTLDGNTNSRFSAGINVNTASALTLYRPYFVETNNSLSSYLAFSAEL